MPVTTAGSSSATLIPVIYPEGVGPEGQLMIAASIVLINVAIYAWPRRAPRNGSSAAKPLENT
jgi:hypothetical protein